MKNNNLYLKSIVIFILSLLIMHNVLAYAGGNGTSGNPYQISNWTDLNQTRLNLSSYFVLTANLSSATTGYTNLGNNWTPIGNSSTKFTGNFNGNNNTISNLKIVAVNNNIGLFGSVTGNISNLGLVDANVSGNYSVGGLVGSATGNITNCYVTGNVSGNNDVGGLVGLLDDSSNTIFGRINNSYSTGSVKGINHTGGLVGASYGRINNSYSTGQVNGSYQIGGLVGSQDLYYSHSVDIFNSYSTGNVFGSSISVGGLVGYSYGNITNCSSSGNVTGSSSNVGGLVGVLDDSSDTVFSVINNSYATGDVKGVNLTGGLVGFFSGKIINSYATGKVNGSWHVGGLVGTQESGNAHSILISNSYSTGNVYGSSTSIGGLVGYSAGLINNSYSLGNVTGSTNYVGGLVGSQERDFYNSPTIVNSYSLGNVLGLLYTGGLVGYQNTGCLINNSFSIGLVNGSDDVGGLVGYSVGRIIYSNSTGNVKGTTYVGGLVGYQDSNGIITNSFSKGIVNGTSDVGGLVGHQYNAKLNLSYSSGNVIGSNINIGGLVGYQFGTKINASYSTGNVSGYENVGGLVGYKDFAGTINYSFSTGKVSGTVDAGGLVGYKDASGPVDNSYWDNQTSNQTISAGGTGKNTIAMKNITTFNTTWNISSSMNDLNYGYPYLGWQNGNLSYTWLVYDSSLTSAPVMNSVTLNATSSSNSSIDNLTAYISAIDADGDNITYAYNWYKNNTLNATTLITNGLVAYYPLNNDTLDYYGSNDGTNINSTQVDGNVGNSYSFNGNSSRLSLPNNPVFETNTQGTISAWVKMYSSPDYATIYSYSDSASANYFMQFMLSFRRVVGYVRQQDGTNYIRITSNTPLNVGQLYYVVWTNNGTNYSIYVDGVLQNITLLSEGVGLEGDWFEKIKDNAENSNIGALERTSLNSYFNGTIDELMIYNRSLTASEVKQLYDGSRNGGNNLSSDLTSTGDVWKVGVTPADSLYWGNELNSSTITILNSCTPPSTNNDWQVFWSDNCVLSSNTNLGTGTLYLYGDVTGTFTLNANLTARKRILMPITNAKFIQLPGSKLILA